VLYVYFTETILNLGEENLMISSSDSTFT